MQYLLPTPPTSPPASPRAFQGYSVYMLSGASLGVTTAVGMCTAAAITLAGRITPHDECVKAIPLIFLSAMVTIPAGLMGAYLGARFGSHIGTYFSTLDKKIN